MDNLLSSLTTVGEIPINLAIHSLQIMVEKDEDKDGYISIGEALSEQIGRLFSGLSTDFTGLSKKVRAEIQDPNSELYQKIKTQLDRLESLGIKVKKYEAKKIITETKTLTKSIFFGNIPDNFLKDEWLEKLGWSETSVDECDIIVVVYPKASEGQILKCTENKCYPMPKLICFL